MPNLLAKRWLSQGGRVAALAVTSLTLLASQALADAAHAPAAAHGGGEHAGGMPQLDPTTFPTQIFWAAITFFALYRLMSGTVLPRMATVLEARHERIASDLATAAGLKREAEGLNLSIEQQLTKARVEAQGVIASTVAAIDADSHAAQSKLVADLAEKLRLSELDVGRAKARAIGNIRSAAADIARDVVAKLGGGDVAAADIDAAAADAMKERGL